jgi:hypothetical protein
MVTTRNCSCGFVDISTPAARESSHINTNKIIQGACRVPSSLYTMTKASINVASIPVVRFDKHGSYARYLDRKKGKGPLLTQVRENLTTVPIYGNKTRMIGLMPNCHCK